MKVKKYYLGITILICTSVSVIATKATESVRPYYYYNPYLPVTLRCVPVNEPNWCQPEITTPCTYGTSGYQVYLEKQGVTCRNPLYTPQ